MVSKFILIIYYYKDKKSICHQPSITQSSNLLWNTHKSKKGTREHRINCYSNGNLSLLYSASSLLFLLDCSVSSSKTSITYQMLKGIRPTYCLSSHRQISKLSTPSDMLVISSEPSHKLRQEIISILSGMQHRGFTTIKLF